MGSQLTINDECLAPEKYVYVKYKGPDSWAVSEAIASANVSTGPSRKYRPNMPGARVVWNATPASRAAISSPSHSACVPRSSASWKPGARIRSSVARPAAIATGLPLSVPAW